MVSLAFAWAVVRRPQITDIGATFARVRVRVPGQRPCQRLRSSRVGVALTLGALAASKDLSCGAPFYGVNWNLFEAHELKYKAVQAHFGAEDKMEGFSDISAAKKLHAELLGVTNEYAEVYVYPKVGHAFMNESPAPFASFEERKEKMGFPPYDAEQAELAWTRLFEFFGKHLKGLKDET